MNPGALSNHIFGTHVLFDVKTTTVYGLLTGKKKKKKLEKRKSRVLWKRGQDEKAEVLTKISCFESESRCLMAGPSSAGKPRGWAARGKPT